MRWFWQKRPEKSLCECAHRPEKHVLRIWQGPGRPFRTLIVAASEAHRVVVEFAIFDPSYDAHHVIEFHDAFGVRHRIDTSIARAVGLTDQ